MSNLAVADLVAALSRPDAWPDGRGPEEIVQTNASVVFVGAERVFKVKKPVNLGFLDYSTLARRRDLCHEEVRLNRRLAPDTYLGVAAIVRDDAGVIRLVPAGTEPALPPLEYAVEMRRLPRERMLERLLDSGHADEALLARVVDRILAFHADAETGERVNRHATPDAIATMVEQNLEQLAPYATGAEATVPPALHARLVASSRAFLAANRDLLEARIRGGRIREGHGDLHARNICVPTDRVVIYDCIEFSEAFRCADVARDVAFLLVDLETHGRHDLATFAASRYAAGADDPDFRQLLPFYEKHLACVLAKIDSIASRDETLPAAARAAARRRAVRAIHVAARFVLPPALLLLCGLPGSGKSTVARTIAAAFGATVLSSDVTRKTLAGLAPGARPTGAERDALYAAAMTDRTYAALLDGASTHLAAGRTVVIDATLPTAARRAPFAALAARTATPLLVVHLDPPEAVARDRLDRRAADSDEPSDAGPDVRRTAARAFEPPREFAPFEVLHVGQARPPRDVLSDLIVRLIEHESGRPVA